MDSVMESSQSPSQPVASVPASSVLAKPHAEVTIAGATPNTSGKSTVKRPLDKNDSLKPLAKKIKLFNGNFDDGDDSDSSDTELGVEKDSDKKVEQDINQSSLRTTQEKSNAQFEKDLQSIFNEPLQDDHKQHSPEEVRNEPTSVENNTTAEATTTATVEKDGLTIPADSELLKKNEALKSYSNFVQESSPSIHSQSSVQNQLLSIPLNLPAPQYLPPNIQLLINTIPALDNLATQILRVIVQSPYQKILDLVANPETLAGMTYQTLISLFDNIKSMYSTEDPFLSVEHLTFGLWKEGSAAPTFFRGKEDTVQSTLRKVNLATFLNATLGTIDTGFFYLNESFLDVFCPDQTLNPSQTITNLSSAAAEIYDVATLSGHSVSSSLGKLLKSQTVLYLELKTQAYISALEAHDRSREDILNDIFPDNLDEFLLKRKTRYNDNLRDKPILTPSEVDFISRCKKRKENLLQSDINEDLSEQYDWLTFLKDFFEFSRKHIGYLIWGTKNSFEQNTLANNKISSLRSSISRTLSPVIPSSSSGPTSGALGTESNPGEFKYDPDSLPSEIVQHHREAKFSSSNVKHLSRRLWTKPEEQALKEALQLKGPQWSQILELYGAGGAVSEALKNRTQVQLKDKARNWKIFFLKNGLPLPDYLKNVTGDLESNKGGAKRSKKALDNNKHGNRPPRIEQRHVDAAAAAAASASANSDSVVTDSSPAVLDSLQKVNLPLEQQENTGSSVNEISDDANIFAQQLPEAEKINSKLPEEEKQQEVPKTLEDVNNNNNNKITKADQQDKKETESNNTTNPREDEEPDYHYHNLLKDLFDQATTDGGERDNNKNSTEESHATGGVDSDVQRLVDEVINAEKNDAKVKDEKANL